MLTEGKQLFPAVMSSLVTHDAADCLEQVPLPGGKPHTLSIYALPDMSL